MEIKQNETMKKKAILFVSLLMFLFASNSMMAQQRRPVDSQHPLWLVHVDVWYKADPQKIINLIPEDLRPYVCLNLSLSCQYDKDKNVYKMPQNAFQTYKSWGTVCQQNGMWFTCQPASGGHTHIQDNDLVTFEYFFKQFPNFLGWNYAEQFWGFDEAGDKSSSTQMARWQLFAKLVEMSHQYGGFLTVSFCGNVWSHPLNPIGEMKRCKALLTACQNYPEAILWLYKYTTSSCFYNNESVSYGPFISGLAKNYGVRYDNCGWNGAMSDLVGSGKTAYPAAAGIGTVMEQMCVNGGAVWDGPELTWNQECFVESNQTTDNGYTRRNWTRTSNMNGVWIDMFRKILDGSMYIPTREEVLEKTKIVVINDKSSGDDEAKYATWGTLYDGLYKQTDPANRGNGQWMDNYCYFKSTGRYGAIPLVIGLYDDAAKQIPVQVKKSNYTSRWSTNTKKKADFDAQYPEVSKGDLYVNRFRNQLVTYTPYTYLNKKTRASAAIPLLYNTCDTMELKYDKLSSGIVREYADSICFYLNNYRCGTYTDRASGKTYNDTTTLRSDTIILYGTSAQPTYKLTKHSTAKGNTSATEKYDAEMGLYKLTVKHCGAVDVTIKCSGKAERDASLPVIEQKALPMPNLPELYRGPIIIEAEDMDFKSIKSCVTDPYGWYPNVRGHAGNGFMDMGTNSSGALRHKLNLKAGQEGDYLVSVRYTCASKAGNIALTINGEKQTVKCEKTATNEWCNVTVKTTLKEGSNTLIITNSGALPMYIDQVTYQPADVEPMKYQVSIRNKDHGTITSDKTETVEGDTVTLSISTETGFKLKALKVVNSVFFAWEKTISLSTLDEQNATLTFVMPHDNVTIEPVYDDATSAYKLDLGNTQGGTIPMGWRCVQENNEVHEYPNSYGQGARVMAGFTGYEGKGLYWRNDHAEYGRQSKYPLTLEPGKYKLTYAMAAWKATPKYKVEILDADDKAIASSAVATATPNANGNGSANLSSAKENGLSFDISAKGNYVISFTDQTSGGDLHEFLLLECRINRTGDIVDGIRIVNAENPSESVTVYDLSGARRPATGRGVNIIRTPDGKTRKVWVK